MVENYGQVDAELQGRCKRSRKVANNTYLQRREGDAIALLLHNTDIITFYPDRIVVDVKGWTTPTTKDRLNHYLPPGCSIYQEDRIWYYQCGGRNDPNTRTVTYADGLTLDYSGKVLSGDNGLAPKEMKRRKRAARRFARDYMRAFMTGDVPAPSNGDCFYCNAGLRTDAGQTLGEAMQDADHILSHFEERYFVPSLLARAREAFPTPPISDYLISDKWAGTKNYGSSNDSRLQDFAAESLEKALYRYLCRQLGLAG